MSTEDTSPDPGSPTRDGQDVFVKNLTTGAVTYVSRAGGASGAAGNSSSSLSEISGDGKRVAFASSSSNLGGGLGGIYVRDLVTNQTILASRDAAGNTADAGSGDRSTSPRTGTASSSTPRRTTSLAAAGTTTSSTSSSTTSRPA